MRIWQVSSGKVRLLQVRSVLNILCQVVTGNFRLVQVVCLCHVFPG
jgi:hypothetical protein